MEIISATAASLFPIDLTALIFWSRIKKNSRIAVFLNNELNKGKPENRDKVARGGLPTFNWVQEDNGTWRLLHIPLNQISIGKLKTKLQENFSSFGHSLPHISDNLLNLGNSLDELEKQKDLSTQSIYRVIVRHIFSQNLISNYEIFDYSPLRRGVIPDVWKLCIFKKIYLMCSELPKELLKGGKIIDVDSNECFTHVHKNANDLVFSNKNNSVIFTESTFLTHDFSFTGNLELIICSTNNHILSHTPWYASVCQKGKGLTVLEVITPMTCQDSLRSSFSSDNASKYLSPKGYSLLDYPTTHPYELMHKLLADPPDSNLINYWYTYYANYPSATEKVSKNQGNEVNKFLLYQEEIFHDFIKSKNYKRYFPEPNAINNIIFMNFALKLIRDWINIKSPKSPSDNQLKSLKSFFDLSDELNLAEIVAKGLECSHATNTWLKKQGAVCLVEPGPIDLEDFKNIKLNEKYELTNDSQKNLSRFNVSIHKLSVEYLKFVSFFLGAVLKADVFRTALLSKEFSIIDSVDFILASRRTKTLEHSVSVLK